MKHFSLTALFFVLVVLMSACSMQRKVAKNNAYNKSYGQYLSSVINDTSFFEFTQLSVVDKSIYPILDSVILLSEKCKYFDSKLKYLNAFRFRIVPKSDKRLYSIDAHLSPAQAIGLILLETGAIEQITDISIFYYKHYLFVVPSFNLGEEGELKDFPFVKMTDTVLKIRAPKSFYEKVYSSYISFTRQDGSYKITENEICRDEILIR